VDDQCGRIVAWHRRVRAGVVAAAAAVALAGGVVGAWQPGGSVAGPAAPQAYTETQAVPAVPGGLVLLTGPEPVRVVAGGVPIHDKRVVWATGLAVEWELRPGEYSVVPMGVPGSVVNPSVAAGTGRPVGGATALTVAARTRLEAALEAARAELAVAEANAAAARAEVVRLEGLLEAGETEP
jgi:hypothetical protein